ncbi:MAG: hypothetical protein LBE06_07275 [Azoarcus sp.]|jgi:hypothetical protein|nr:hypothetical protein [Azoarcus sp.]
MKFFKVSVSWLVAFILCGNLLSCAQKNSDTPGNANDINNSWKIPDHSEYSIQYPLDWELNQCGMAGTRFLILSDMDSENDDFRENLNLITEPATMDLDAHIEAVNHLLPQVFTNYQKISLEKIRDGSGEHYEMISIFDMETPHTRVKNRQHFWIANEKAYTLTWSSTLDRFDDYRETGEKILKSFRIKQ